MTFRFVAAFVPLVLAATPVQAPPASQAARPDFSGTWVMDTTKFEKRDPVLVSLTLTIAQGRDTLSVYLEVGDKLGPSEPVTHTTTVARYLINGRGMQNRMLNGTLATSNLSWDHETLVLRSAGPAPDGQTLELITRWTLEGGGTRLIQQQRVQHGGRVANQTLLFTKQEETTPR